MQVARFSAGRLVMATNLLRAAKFMRRAHECERLAKTTTEPPAYIELAKQWLELARQWLELAKKLRGWIESGRSSNCSTVSGRVSFVSL